VALLTVVGEDTHEVFSKFTWANGGDKAKIELVLHQFKQYYQLRKNVPFESYCFNCRMQEEGELYEQYRMELCKLA